MNDGKGKALFRRPKAVVEGNEKENDMEELSRLQKRSMDLLAEILNPSGEKEKRTTRLLPCPDSDAAPIELGLRDLKWALKIGHSMSGALLQTGSTSFTPIAKRTAFPKKCGHRERTLIFPIAAFMDRETFPALLFKSRNAVALLGRFFPRV